MLTASQRWYRANKEYVKQRAKERTEKLVRLVHLAKMNPCMDCGVQYLPCQMDFDHVRGKKVDNISDLVKKGNETKLLTELEKCELVCSNCHRLRTWVRSNGAYGFDVLVSNSY